jgi:transposase InsO family protein
MPWKETCVMDEKLKFLGKYLRQESTMSSLCREFNISRKTGYKMVHRYLLEGPVGIYERTRAPHNHPQGVSEEITSMVLALRSQHSDWGPRKLLSWLNTHHPRIHWPSASTIGRILAGHGKIVPYRRRSKTPPYTQPFKSSTGPNKVWCADFKGWFRTGDGSRCEPLTITDSYSRFVLACRVLPAATHAYVRPVFESLFRQYGLPWAIRTDNGTPFASNALGGLSRLSVWWIKLGILPERIEPGHPQQNGRHERFHRTLKKGAISPPRYSLAQQQEAFDLFCREFNQERPHEALNDQTPSACYHPSQRPFPSHPPQIAYPDHMMVRKVRPSGQIRWKGKELFLSETLIGEPVGLELIESHIYKIYYGSIELTLLDEKKGKLIKPPVKWKKRC